MIDTARPELLDLATLRRAFDAADPDGDAALNWLLYSAGALVMSAVFLVTTSPTVVGIALAVVPWLLLAAAGWLWIAPAMRDQATQDQRRREQAHSARSLAADVLLDDEASPEARRAAAAAMLDLSD